MLHAGRPQQRGFAICKEEARVHIGRLQHDPGVLGTADVTTATEAPLPKLVDFAFSNGGLFERDAVVQGPCTSKYLSNHDLVGQSARRKA